MSELRPSIVAYGGEDSKYDPVYARGVELARQSGASLILYDAEAGSRFGAPQPTFWSGDQDRPDNHGRLTPGELEARGRESFGRRVQEAIDMGIDAHGWLPDKKGAKELADYATSQGAYLVVVPSDLDNKGLSDWFKGSPSVDEVTKHVDTPVVVVEVTKDVDTATPVGRA